MPELVIEAGDGAGTTFSFVRRIVIGRGDIADVRIDDVTISRRHAEIRPRDDGGWELVDLGSANGVLVNDERLSGSRVLADGDRLDMGQIKLRFRGANANVVTPGTQATPIPIEPPGGRLFQEMLSRVRLFCDLGALGAERHAPAELARRACELLLRAFARADRAAVFLHAAMGDALTLIGQATRDSRPMQPTAVNAVSHEATRHQFGLLLIDEQERLALTQRLRVPQLYGAAAAVPIRFNGEALGAIYIDSLKDPGALRGTDHEHLIAVANLLGALLAPAREPARDFDMERHDLTLCRRIQQRFLPQAPPSLSGYAIVDDYAAARVIGGDHYDFVALADSRQAMIVADVSGKALSGALYMARLGAVLRQASARTRRATELLEDINATLYSELEAGMFVTMLVVVLEPRSGIIEIASAGHPAPLVRGRDGEVRQLAIEGGPPLGAMSEPRYPVVRHQLESGECMLLFTDGLDEAHNQAGELFGLKRAQTAVARGTDARGVINALRDDLARFVGTEPQSDDLTLLAIERL